MKYLILLLALAACSPQEQPKQQQKQATQQSAPVQGGAPAVVVPQAATTPAVAPSVPSPFPPEETYTPTGARLQTCFDASRAHYYQLWTEVDGRQYLWPSPAPCDCNFFGTITVCAVDLNGTQGITCYHNPAWQSGTYIGNCPAGVK